jgi:Transmembrane secretion effector
MRSVTRPRSAARRWGAVYALAAVIFLTAAILTSGIKLTTQPKSREPATLKSLFAGFVYIRGQPAILGALSLDLFAVLLGSVTALLPIYARDILHTGPWGLGVLRAAPAIGAVLMAIVMVRYPLDRRVGHVMFASVAVFGAANIVFGISDLFALSCVALIVAGGADMVSVVIRSTLVQLDTPDDMRGRVAAVNSVFIGTSNQLGQFWAGVVAAMIGAVPAVIIGGIGTLVVVAVSMRLFPGLVTRDTLATPETKS